MSVLTKIRNRAGLLVGIVGAALLIFILEAALESGNFFFKSSNDVGEIAGKGIPYQEFNARVQESIDQQSKSSGRSLEDFQRDMVVQQIWNSFINERVMDKEYEKVGISVSADELTDLMVEHPHPNVVRQISDPKTGQIAPAFADPATGQLSVIKLKEFTQQMNPEQEASWVKLEEYIRKIRVSEKYNNLIKKGIYVTASQAKMEYLAQNKQFNVRYVSKKYAMVPDSTIKVEESDIRNYYNSHLNEFKEAETTRKIEYVSFDVNPTADDIQDIKNDLAKLAVEFKAKTGKEDSTFVVSESDSRTFDATWHKKGTLSANLDSVVFKEDAPGLVVGPYMENNSFKLAKVVGVKMVSDSSRVRHILIAYKGAERADPSINLTREKAKETADSLLKVIKAGGAKFTDLVEKMSNDPGKNARPDKKPGEYYMGKGGDYGWLNEKSGFQESFKNAGLDGKKGELVVVESPNGFHLMEILDTKGSVKKVKVGIIDKKIVPSSKTEQAVYAQATEFAGKLTSSELFSKMIAEEKLNKREADNIKEGDRVVPGLDNSKELVRWMFGAKKGDIFQAQQFGNKFIVAQLTAIKEKGVQPLDVVRTQVEIKAKQEKKAEKFAEEMAGATSVDELAKKLNTNVDKMDNLNFAGSFLAGAGKEESVIGTAVTLKPNGVSKPIKGNNGVYVVVVDAVREAPAPEAKDLNVTKMSALSQLQTRAENEVFDALKEAAHVIDHKGRFF